MVSRPMTCMPWIAPIYKDLSAESIFISDFLFIYHWLLPRTGMENFRSDAAMIYYFFYIEAKERVKNA